MSQHSLVLQGSLSDISVDEVLSTISLSRSCLRVEFDDEDAATIVIKAGNVLRAQVGPQEGGIGAFQALRRRHAGGFRVYRDRYDARGAAPIGRLSDLLAELVSASEPDDLLLLAGAIDAASLPEVLDVMSLSRQLLALRLFRADGSVGQVLCKAGLVLRASIEPDGLEERAALLALRRVPPVRFELARPRRTGALPRPIGSLAELGPSDRLSIGAAGSHKSVIRGDFEEYSFLDVLQIVTASRQVLEITLTRRGEWRGVVLVKAGKLLDARSEGGDVGVAALYALIAEPGDAFDAVLSRRAKLPATPLGDLRHLTAAAAQGPQVREVSDQGALDVEEDGPLATEILERPPEPPRDESVTAVGQAPAPVSPVAAELTHLARGIGRIEQQLGRQDQLLERALGKRPAPEPANGARGLVWGVLAAQLLVAALLVVLIGVIALT